MSLTFAAPSSGVVPLHVVSPGTIDEWLSAQKPAVQSWAKVNGFSAKLGETLVVPDADGVIMLAAAGYDTPERRTRTRYALAHAAGKLPEGSYEIVFGLPDDRLETECVGWLLAGYEFNRYRDRSGKRVGLVAPVGVDTRKVETIVAGEVLIRDLANTPTSDLGPAELQETVENLAREFGAKCTSVVGDDLLGQNLPLIHTVGRAAETQPRLIEMNWGTEGPKLTLVGKGVCFDTGGLNLKPGSSMALMKKDMGGAANVLGLARMIMGLSLPLQLRVLIPAVENSVSGNAFRPGDILTSRKGLTIEINNTDAEGRLVLADALTLADEGNPDLVVSMATLTGAARVAVGPDIAPFYTDGDAIAHSVSDAAQKVDDPVWRMPFHAPYEEMIEPGIADLDNAPSGGFAGSITAALFLRRFVGSSDYAHFDIYSWQPTARPARPKGGVGQAVRALLEALPELLEL